MARRLRPAEAPVSFAGAALPATSLPATSLPALRDDLHCYPGVPDRDGAPAWIVEDRVSNRFFRIGWLDAVMLAQWHHGEPAAVAAAVADEIGVLPSAEEILALAGFLQQHELVRISEPVAVDRLVRQARRQSQAGPGTWLRSLLHHYLFFRVPLVRPGRWLRALLPWVSWWWHPAFTALTIAVAVLGLVLAVRQWDRVAHAAIDWLSPAGLVAIAVALALAKAVHELGHALTATRFGVRVGHMGVAFLVLWPMLYTDTAESWRLIDRRQRFAIAAAGIRAELVLAAFATFGWALADDGPWRDGLFLLATTSWVMTLAINASPFMRFDGYFLLADALDLPNLHARAFALARAALRRGLLGWNEVDPEAFAPSLRRSLVAFAWLTWIYRAVLFLGIALAVYHLFFKALGLLLLAVELVWFIGRPIAAELVVWRRGRHRTQRGHALRSLLAVMALLAMLALPWSTGIEAQGWLHAARSQRIHAPVAARLVDMSQPGPVQAGAELFRLDSASTRHRARLASLAITALERQIDQSVGRDDGAVRRLQWQEEWVRHRAALSAEQAELARLTLRAPFDGVLVDVDPELALGGWVSPQQPLGVLVDPAAWIVEALVPESAIERVAVGAAARFRPWRGLGPALTGTVLAIDPARVEPLPHPLFAATQGGEIAVRAPTGRDAAAAGPAVASPAGVFYRVRIRVSAPALLREASGQVLIDAPGQSLLTRGWRALVAGWVRESGF